MHSTPLPLSSAEPVIFAPMEAPDIEEAADLVGRIFVSHEPTTRCLGITSEVFMPFALAYCRSAATAGTGVVARQGRHLLAVAVCLDLLEDVGDAWPELGGEQYAAKLPDLAFVSTLEGPFVDENQIGPGDCAHIAQVAVVEHARGRGIATALLEQAMRRARLRGFRMIAALCTGPASRRAHEKAGFAVARTLRYDSYVHEGRRVFASLEGECALMVLRFPEGAARPAAGEAPWD